MKRRDFIKISGAAALATACAPRIKVEPAKEGEGMEYRINPKNGDKTSLLGYGCMRWPMIPGPDGKDIIDQEAVNEMV
ncbi:MAG: twin-arginine translocation signal domain-containing protein, partial [Bacteroidales bacterium]|nr:twin-arginine translocation signal domain-containing protein [Bacteroidales bacterium]